MNARRFFKSTVPNEYAGPYVTSIQCKNTFDTSLEHEKFWERAKSVSGDIHGRLKKNEHMEMAPDELIPGNYVEESGNAYTLVIQNVAVADGGNYTCKGDRSESIFTLFIECKYLSMYYQFATFMLPIMQFVFSTKFCTSIDLNPSWN